MSVPVTISGGAFTWTTAFVALLNVLVGGALVAFIRARAPMGKIKAEREANLMTSMSKRIDALEAHLALAAEELRVVRHDLANANTSLDMFIALIETNPERAAEHAKRVKAYRDETSKRIGEEKAALTKARVAQIGGGQ